LQKTDTVDWLSSRTHILGIIISLEPTLMKVKLVSCPAVLSSSTVDWKNCTSSSLGHMFAYCPMFLHAKHWMFGWVFPLVPGTGVPN